MLRVPTLDKRQVCCLKIFQKEANRNLLQQARLVVVASAIPVQTCKKVASVPGPKTANLIFTLDRKQKYFGAFFKEPFERMRDGQEMPFCMRAYRTSGPLQRGRYSRHDPYRRSGQANTRPIEPVAFPDRFRETGWRRSAPQRPRGASPKQDQ